MKVVMVTAPANRDDSNMATRRLVTRCKGRLKGIRSALRVALFPHTHGRVAGSLAVVGEAKGRSGSLGTLLTPRLRSSWLAGSYPAPRRLQTLPVMAPAAVLPETQRRGHNR